MTGLCLFLLREFVYDLLHTGTDVEGADDKETGTDVELQEN